MCAETVDPKWLPHIEAMVAAGDSVEKVANNLRLPAESVRPLVRAARRLIAGERYRRRRAAETSTHMLDCLKCRRKFESIDRRANRLCENCRLENAESPPAAAGYKNSTPRRVRHDE